MNIMHSAKEWRIVREWQVGDEFFRLPVCETSTEEAARQWIASQPLDPGTGFFVRSPDGNVVQPRVWRPL